MIKKLLYNKIEDIYTSKEASLLFNKIIQLDIMDNKLIEEAIRLIINYINCNECLKKYVLSRK